MNAVAGDIKTNDAGLLQPEQMPGFRTWLENYGVAVRDGGAGQHFHVRIDGKRWLPVERGKAGVAVTPVAMRPLIDAYITATSPSTLLVAGADVTTLKGSTAPSPARPVIDRRTPRSADQIMSESVALATDKKRAREQQALERQYQADKQYLSDLRDDFAVHAPFSHGGFPNEPGDLERLVQLRWQYADLMMQARAAKVGD
jgi:hypothetical protein